MKITGYVFIIFGAIWAIAGFVSYASDIQIGIAITGINMIGIGIIMVQFSKITSNRMEKIHE